MKDLSERISALSPEQRALFEAKLRKKGLDIHATQVTSQPDRIPKRKQLNFCPLSYDQERLWVIDQMEPGNPAYNIYTASRLTSALDVEILRRAINEIVRRHEILRTTFALSGSQPVMVIAPELKLDLPVEDLRALPESEREREALKRINEHAAEPFDLMRGPLIRVGLVRVADHDYFLHVTMHHTITDRWSASVVEQELVLIYKAFSEGLPSPLPEVAIQFADFAAWQREWLEGHNVESQLTYWKNQIAGAPLVLNITTDHPRPPVQTFRGARELILLPPSLLASLKDLSQREGVTMFMTLLAAYNLLLYRYTGQQDILVGLAVSNRERPETVNMLGYLLNMVILRSKFSSKTSFRQLLGIVREAALGAFAHQDMPLGRLIQELKPKHDPARNPIFQVAYIYLDFPESKAMEEIGIKADPVEVDNGTARFDLTLALTELPHGLEALFEYNTDLFERSTINRMLRHLEVLLKAAVTDPDRAVSELPMLTEAELRQALFEWNATASDYPGEMCVQQLVEQQVKRSPDSIAVSSKGQCLTYRELNSRANQLAHYLRSAGCGPEVRVAVCVERSVDFVIGVLAILKAGGVYVPLDPSYPLERLAAMLEDSQPPLVLAQEELLDVLPSYWGQVICLDSDWDVIAAQNQSDPDCETDPDNLAYVIYTSGSTGSPKGVCVTHRAITRLVAGADYVQLNGSDIVAQASNSAFDAATFEIWGALVNGARLEIITRDIALSPDEFLSQIKKLKISAMFLTTALFNQLVRKSARAFVSLTHLLVGGEAADPKWFRDALAEGAPGRLIHVYGPTESTTFATWHLVEAADDEAVTVPIGLPISNTRAYVVSDTMQPVAVGITGELYLGGAGLARCYLNSPALTAERLLPDPVSGEPGARLYKTGDLVRRRASGDIEFLGRNDNQVKLRGFRIEISEIESVIRQHALVDDVAVLMREDSPGDKRLVAYLVTHHDAALTTSEVRRFVMEKLPEYMAPSAVVMMDALPLNINGKIDRAKLPPPELSRPDLESEFVPPGTQIEKGLAEVWTRVLGVEKLGIHDNFFDLGGDSIRCIQVMAEAQKVGLAFTSQNLFLYPTIHGLSDKVQLTGVSENRSDRLKPFSLIDEQDRAQIPEGVTDAYPLARLQAGMIFHSELTPVTAVYHDIFSFHIEALFDAEVMRAALEAVIDRHEALRTSFDLVSYSEPLQLVHEKVDAPLEVIDISHLPESEQEEIVDRLIEAEKGRQFDWTRAPLLRLFLHRRGNDAFQFTLSFHHAILDGWSLASLLNELFQRYFDSMNSRPSSIGPPPALSYRDFVVLERQALESEECMQFWLESFADGEVTTLPRLSADSPKERAQEICAQRISISAEVADGLNRMAKEAAAPLKSVLLAAHLKALSFISGQSNVVTGITMNGRPEEADGEKVLGLFLNTVPFRAALTGGTWKDLVKETFDREREMLPYRRYPMADLQVMTGGQSLFEAAFNFTHFHAVGSMLKLDGMKLLRSKAISETNFTFLADFDLDPATSMLQASLKYDASKLSYDQIKSFSEYYERTLSTLATQPAERYEFASLLSAQERREILVEWNETRTGYPARTIHELFEEQANDAPDSAALTFAGERLTYRELNARANQLAHYLKKLGVGPEVRVGIAVERSIEMIVGLLAILKAGGVYVPLDTAYPKERLAFMLEDTATGILLSKQGILDSQSSSPARVVSLDSDWNVIAKESTNNPASETGPLNLAYIMFTSGSTGVPKGVSITHRGVVRLVKQSRYADMNSSEVFLQLSTMTFDASTFEIWGSLLNGAHLVVMPPYAASLEELIKVIHENHVTTLWLTAGLFNLMVDHHAAELKPLKQLLAGGDVLSPSHVRKFIDTNPGCKLINGYGPTENTTFTCCYRITEAGAGPVPIGRPIANSKVYILDAHLQPSPIGTVGELYIGGDGIARDYNNRPDLTAEKFIPNPFSQRQGARLFRSGDLARYLPDGNIEFIGRRDNQIKLRGFRIELGEIEANLIEHESVREAAVIAREDSPGDRRLVAYVVSDKESVPALIGELRQFLQERLPDYMLPSHFMLLDALPLTANGKVDRRALPPPETADTVSERKYVAPRTPLETALETMWCQVLRIEQAGVEDNFFESGGHSLMATQLVSRIREAFRVDVPLRSLFENPSIARLAEVIEDLLIEKIEGMSDEEAEALLNRRV